MAAKKGNKNALKHGIYSKFIAVVDDEFLDAMPVDDTKQEIKLARARVVDRLTRSENSGDPEFDLKYDAGARHYLEIAINAIERNRERRATEKMRFVSLMDAMRAENVKQNVKR
jgi:hypothetical protein